MERLGETPTALSVFLYSGFVVVVVASHDYCYKENYQTTKTTTKTIKTTTRTTKGVVVVLRFLFST